MRFVQVGPDDITQQPGGSFATGIDDRTHELVKFEISGIDVEAVRRAKQAPMVILVDEDDVISAEPTSGQWDSPGTSEEL